MATFEERIKSANSFFYGFQNLVKSGGRLLFNRDRLRYIQTISQTKLRRLDVLAEAGSPRSWNIAASADLRQPRGRPNNHTIANTEGKPWLIQRLFDGDGLAQADVQDCGLLRRDGNATYVSRSTWREFGCSLSLGELKAQY